MMTTLTSIILRCTYHVAHVSFTLQEDYLGLIFSSYFDFSASPREASTSLASRLFSGVRLPPRGLIAEYMDWEEPRTPRKLVQDLRFCLEFIRQQNPSVLPALLRALIDVHMLLPDEDRDDLLSPVPSSPSVEALSCYWAELLWYAICQDYVQSKKTKKGE